MHIPSNDEIRKAVIKKQMSVETSEDIVLLELGKAVLNTPEGWPEKKEPDLFTTLNSEGGFTTPGCLLSLANEVEKQRLRNDAISCEARNNAIDECRLALLRREVPTVEEIRNVIAEYGPLKTGTEKIQELIKSKQEKKQ